MEQIALNDNDIKILDQWGLKKDSIKHAYHIVFKANDTVLAEKEPINRLLIVTEGRAKAQRFSDEGKTLIINRYISDGFIGELEILNDIHDSIAEITAISDLQCIALPKEQFLKEFNNNIIFSNMMAKVLANKLLNSSNNYANSALYSAISRLAKYIIENSYNNNFADVLTEVATSTGMSYRHMFRLLDEMCQNRILEKTTQGYKILNLDKLNQLINS